MRPLARLEAHAHERQRGGHFFPSTSVSRAVGSGTHEAAAGHQRSYGVFERSPKSGRLHQTGWGRDRRPNAALDYLREREANPQGRFLKEVATIHAAAANIRVTTNSDR